MEDRNSRTRGLIGDEALDLLAQKKVLLFGLGGVGGAVAEALARSNIGALGLVDFDRVSPSNLNRQLIALEGTLGQRKVDAMADRLLAIRSDLEVYRFFQKVSLENIDKFSLSEYDYVVDAIDDLSGKEAIIKEAYRLGLPVVSAMGAGNSLDPTNFQVARLGDTYNCPLARAMRKRLGKAYHGLPVVFSNQAPAVRPGRTPASIAFVPPVMGYTLASVVVRDLIDWQEVCKKKA